MKKDSALMLIDLEKFLPGLKLDIKYATSKNFTGKVLYPSARVFASYPVAKALRQVRAELKKQGFDIKVFDAYRPYSITVKMWDFCLDDRYAATPQKGSRHNRGCALDLTLINLRTGKEMPMPTPFDDFSDKAHDNYNSLPKNVIKNRALLRDVMEKYGFTHLNSEWWHFDFKNWNSHPLMDMNFDTLDSCKQPITN